MKYISYFALIIGLSTSLSSCFFKKNSEGKSKTDATDSTQNTSDTATAVAIEGLNIGNKAPEINEKNPNDESLALSDLKGKMVLIDFWASWCGPCRHENPNVVATYKKYQKAKFKTGTGFEIYSVSLDSNKDKWQEAIAKDGLVWPYHVSDLKQWYSAPATRYGIQEIPNNFLLDGNGVIIAKNLMGADLEEELKKHIKTK